MKLIKRAACLFLLANSMVGYGYAQEGSVKIADLYTAAKVELDPMKLRELANEMDRLAPKVSEPMQDIMVDMGKTYLVSALASSGGNVSEIQRWIAKLQDSAARESAQQEVARKLIQAERYQDAEPIVMKLLKTVEGRTEVPASTATVPLFRYAEKAAVHQLYGTLLYRLEDYEKALPYLTPSPDAGRRSFPNELYALTLMKVGSQEKALEEIERVFGSRGNRSDEFLGEVKIFFSKVYGNDEKYEQFLSKAQDNTNSRIRENVQRSLISEKAPDFTIKDVHGNEVSLASLSGKTVILDFWATWCGPCIASFPAMQKAVDYYENDPSVVFMFVHTAESGRGDPTEEAKKLIADRGLTFDIYMDLKDKETDENPLLKAFKVEGLPTKFIINKEGMIRFRSGGFSGENEVVEEIKLMVEMANNSSVI